MINQISASRVAWWVLHFVEILSTLSMAIRKIIKFTETALPEILDAEPQIHILQSICILGVFLRARKAIAHALCDMAMWIYDSQVEG